MLSRTMPASAASAQPRRLRGSGLRETISLPVLASPGSRRRKKPKRKSPRTETDRPESNTDTVARVRRRDVQRSPASYNIRSYLAGLKDPFFGPIGKLGFGTFVPTALHTCWSVTSPAISAGTGAWAIVMAPALANNSLTLFQAPSSATLLSSATSTAFTWANNTTVGSQCQTGRVVTAGLRCVYRTSANALMASVGGVYIPDDSYSNLQALSFSQIRNLGSYREFHADSSSEKGGQVAYRPIDSTSFDFNADVVNSGTSVSLINSYPLLVISGTGVPANFLVDVSAFLALETLGGTDFSGDDNSSPSSINIDQIGGIMPSVPPPVTPSISTVDLLDHAMSNIRRAIAGRGLSGTRPRDLLALSSSSPPNLAPPPSTPMRRVQDDSDEKTSDFHYVRRSYV